MKQAIIIFLVIISFLSTSICCAQEIYQEDNPVFNSQGLTYDSVMKVLSDKTILFYDKFEMVRDIESIVYKAKVTKIYNTILHQAKREEDKHYMVDLYSSLANINIQLNDLPVAKVYLDSAFAYENRIDNISSLALMNYIMSQYYATAGEEDVSHSYLYKTIEYFEQTEGKKSTAILLLHQLSVAFVKHKDVASLKKNVDRMMALSLEVDSEMSSIHTYTSAREYYSLMYLNSGDSQYQDSMLKYGSEIIKINEAASDLTKNMIKSQVIENYLCVADILSSAPNPDWNKIMEYVKVGDGLEKTLLDKQLGATNNKILKHRLNAKILLFKGRLDEALSETLESLHIMENELSGNHHFTHLETYSLLIQIYEKKQNFKLALQYSQKKNEIETTLDSERRYRAVKELETKYETSQRELKITQLNEERQSLAYERALLIASMIIAIILLLALVIYQKMKKSQQERESALMASGIEQKESEYQSLLLETEANKMRSYIDGLEVERERLSKDLHDDVSNELVAIKMQIENGTSKEQLVESLTKLHANIRNISRGLIPPVFKHATLTEVLEDYVFQLNNKTGLLLLLELDNRTDLDSISDATCMEIYRIVQEAVGNAVRHAKASQIVISCQKAEEVLKVSITDNGKGFDTAREYQGLGLKILKERAKLIDGELTVSSSYSGSSIELQCPLYSSAMAL